jgi:ADP-heptose:LPS heptosyltransferase
MLRRNVLIFQTGGLGDFVLTWPFAVGLGRIYPQSRIIYVTHQQKGDLARRVLRLEATDIEAGWHALFTDRAVLPPHASTLLETAHSIYSFLPVTPVWKENVLRISHLARCVEIDPRLPAGFTGHLTNHLLGQLKNHPPERAALEQMLRSIADRGVGFKTTPGSDVLIHPGSGSRDKCWPLDRYIELAGQLKNAGKTVRFITGEVEQDRWSQTELKSLAAVATHRHCSTLLELLAEISTAGCFIGNDSGPAHLAGIVGIPTLALFGPTDPAQWKPLGPRVQVLRAQPLDGLPIDQVMQFISHQQKA